MGRASVKPNKNLFQVTREDLGLSREKASELLGTVTPDRLVKIENEKVNPYPEEILAMSQGYQKPALCNYYCSNVCPIGKIYVPEVKMKDLSRIVLEMIASMNRMSAKKDRLIEIAADGEISKDELADFSEIHDELGRISMAIEALTLWNEEMKACSDAPNDI